MSPTLAGRAAPVSQSAEEIALKATQSGFESQPGHPHTKAPATKVTGASGGSELTGPMVR